VLVQSLRKMLLARFLEISDRGAEFVPLIVSADIPTSFREWLDKSPSQENRENYWKVNNRPCSSTRGRDRLG
jgi:hypothetical protein